MNYINHYDKNKDKIFSYFYYNLKDSSLAEDLTSETFLKWYEKFDRYDSNYEFSTWIFTIARNNLIDYYRKTKQDISLDENEELSNSELISYEENFSKKIDIEIQMKDIYMALSQIPVEQKEIILMKYLSELSTKEISDLSWKTEANIRKIISRWLKKIEWLLA